METKVCTKCNEEKSIDDFDKKTFTANGYFWDGHDHRCKVCKHKDSVLRIRLNKGFASLKTDYCECCGDTSSQIMIDHDHDSLQFRGFVCKSCNVNLKHNGDTFETIMKSDCEDMYKKYIKMAQFRQGKKVR